MPARPVAVGLPANHLKRRRTGRQADVGQKTRRPPAESQHPSRSGMATRVPGRRDGLGDELQSSPNGRAAPAPASWAEALDQLPLRSRVGARARLREAVGAVLRAQGPEHAQGRIRPDLDAGESVAAPFRVTAQPRAHHAAGGVVALVGHGDDARGGEARPIPAEVVRMDGLDEDLTAGVAPEAGVQVQVHDLAGIPSPVPEVLPDEAGRGLRPLAAEEEARRVFVLALGHGGAERGQAMAADGPGGPDEEQVGAPWRRVGIQQPVHAVVERRRARVRLAEVEEVAVEIDVLLVGAAAPGEAVGVEGVDQDDGSPRRNVDAAGAHLFQPRQLNRRAEEPLDAVQPGRDDDRPRRAGGADGRDVDGQRLAAGAASGERESLEHGARPPRRVAEAPSSDRVAGREGGRGSRRRACSRSSRSRRGVDGQ